MGAGIESSIRRKAVIKIIKMTDELNKLIQDSERIFLPKYQCYAELSNFGFLEVNGCVNAVLTDFNVFLEHDIQVQKIQIVPLKEWFQTGKLNLIDSLRFYARANQIELCEMIGTVGRITVETPKGANNRDVSVITSYKPEFDEELIICA